MKRRKINKRRLAPWNGILQNNVLIAIMSDTILLFFLNPSSMAKENRRKKIKIGSQEIDEQQ